MKRTSLQRDFTKRASAGFWKSMVPTGNDWKKKRNLPGIRWGDVQSWKQRWEQTEQKKEGKEPC